MLPNGIFTDGKYNLGREKYTVWDERLFRHCRSKDHLTWMQRNRNSEMKHSKKIYWKENEQSIRTRGTILSSLIWTLLDFQKERREVVPKKNISRNNHWNFPKFDKKYKSTTQKSLRNPKQNKPIMEIMPRHSKNHITEN